MNDAANTLEGEDENSGVYDLMLELRLHLMEKLESDWIAKGPLAGDRAHASANLRRVAQAVERLAQVLSGDDK